MNRNYTESFSILFWPILFIFLNCINHILLTSIVTFFHLQLDHRLVDIQDWIQVHFWSLYLLRLLFSFFIFERLISTFYSKNNFIFLMKEKFFFDLDLKIMGTLCLSLGLSLIITFVPVSHEFHFFWSFKSFMSFVGHTLFLTILTLVYLMASDCFYIKNKYHYLLALIYTMTFFTVETYFLKQMLPEKLGSFTTLYIVLYVAIIKKRSSFQMSFFLILFVLAPFLSFFGEDIIHGSEYSPFILSHKFSITASLSLTVMVGFILWIMERRDRAINNRP